MKKITLLTTILMATLFLFTLSAQAGHVDLTIIAPTLNEDGTQCTDLASYNVYIGKVSGIYLDHQNTGTVVNTYTWTNLQEGTVYCFAVTSLDTSGNESTTKSNEICRVASADVCQPPVLQ